MNDKVYIVVGSSGSWEYSREWYDKAFLDENKAEEYKDKLNADLNERKKKNESLILSEEEECLKETCEGCDGCGDSYDNYLDEQHDFKVDIVDLVI